MFHSLSRPPVTEEALEQIKELITSGKIPVGGKLPPENQLVAMLGVSRSTVREVLITLQAEGYIEIKRGKGAFVIDKEEFDRKKFIEWFQANQFEIQELLEFRMAVEPMAAFLAAQRITEEEVNELEKIYLEFIKSIHDKKIEEIVKGDERFHEMIFQASRNQLLQFVYSNFIPALHEYRRRAFSPPANPNLAIDAHKEILEAIQARDSEEAAKRMLSHIQASQNDIVGTANAIYSIETKRTNESSID